MNKNKINDMELENVVGGTGSEMGAELGKKQPGANLIPMVCNDGCNCKETFYISGRHSVVRCPYCSHLYVING